MASSDPAQFPAAAQGGGERNGAEALSFRHELPSVDILIDGSFVTTAPFDSHLPGSLTFALGERYLATAAANPAIAAILVPPALRAEAERLVPAPGKALGLDDDPRATFFALHNRLTDRWIASLPPPVIMPGARIADSAKIGPGARIEPEVEIGDFAVIGHGVTLERGVYVGEAALVGVVGHFEQMTPAGRLRVRHAGRLSVGRNTQILPGAIVQRDVYANRTRIGANVSIGPGARLAHGVCVGDRTTLTGGTVVAGFTRIGADVFVGPACVIGNNLTLGDGCRCEIGAVVIRDVPARERVSGNFAGKHTSSLREWAGRR